MWYGSCVCTHGEGVRALRRGPTDLPAISVREPLARYDNKCVTKYDTRPELIACTYGSAAPIDERVGSDRQGEQGVVVPAERLYRGDGEKHDNANPAAEALPVHDANLLDQGGEEKKLARCRHRSRYDQHLIRQARCTQETCGRTKSKRSGVRQDETQHAQIRTYLISNSNTPVSAG